MKVLELKQIVNRRDSLLAPREEDNEVMIAIKLPYNTVGSMPMVPVKCANFGFDWESGKFILTPEEPLTPSDRDFGEKMRKMQEDLGNALYENRGLKSEIKRLKKSLTGP